MLIKSGEKIIEKYKKKNKFSGNIKVVKILKKQTYACSI